MLLHFTLLPGKEDIYVIDALTQISLERYAAGLGEAVGLYFPDPRTNEEGQNIESNLPAVIYRFPEL